MSEVSKNPHDNNLTDERNFHAGMKNVPDDVVERPSDEHAQPISHGEEDEIIRTIPNTPGEINLTPEEIAHIEALRAKQAHEKKPLWLKLGAGVAGLGLLATGVFVATRGGDKASAKPPVATSSPNPGTPSASETTGTATAAPAETGAVGSKDQKEMLRNLNLSTDVFPDLSQYELKSVNPSAYQELLGGGGRLGLFPEAREGLAQHKLLVQQVTPESIALLQQKNNYFLNAKYTIVNGDSTKQVDATEFYGDSKLWFSGQNKEGLLFNMNRPFDSKADEANKVATALIPSENGVAAQFIARREELSRYKEMHADSAQLAISDPVISTEEVVRRMYLMDGAQVDTKVRDAAIGGKTELNLLPAEGKAYILKSYELSFKSADGSATAELPAASVAYRAEGSGKYVLDLVVVYPVDERIKSLPSGASIQKGVTNTFQMALLDRVTSK